MPKQHPVPRYTTRDGLEVIGYTVIDSKGCIIEYNDPRAKAARMERDAFARDCRHPGALARYPKQT